MSEDKDKIISELKRLTLENKGVTLGEKTFRDITEFKRSNWRGKYWINWSDLVREAGLMQNFPAEKMEQSFLIQSLANLTRKYKRFPTYAEIRFEKGVDKNFPHYTTLKGLGSKEEQQNFVRKYAEEHDEYSDLLNFLPSISMGENADDNNIATNTKIKEGSVYMLLLKMGNEKRYKIGKSILVERRKNEISIVLPEDVELVHEIKTDDAYGIEAYWHKRFEDKNTKGEWFKLTKEDIQAFKKRKFM